MLCDGGVYFVTQGSQSGMKSMLTLQTWLLTKLLATPIKLEGRWDCCSVFVCTLLTCIYFSSYGVIMHHSGISTRNYCSLHIIVNDSVQFVISAFYHGCLCYHQDIKCSAHQKVLRATGINAKQSHFKWMKRVHRSFPPSYLDDFVWRKRLGQSRETAFNNI